jgi:hypothetical protein
MLGGCKKNLHYKKIPLFAKKIKKDDFFSRTPDLLGPTLMSNIQFTEDSRILETWQTFFQP